MTIQHVITEAAREELSSELEVAISALKTLGLYQAAQRLEYPTIEVGRRLDIAQGKYSLGINVARIDLSFESRPTDAVITIQGTTEYTRAGNP